MAIDSDTVDSYRSSKDGASPIMYRLLPSPNPKEVVLAVRVYHDALQPSMLNAIEVGVTKYGDLPRIWIPMRTDEFKNYVFTDKIVAGETSYWFLFGPPKTLDEANTPFRSTPSFGDHPWDPILIKLKFIRDRSFPNVINNAQTTNGSTQFGLTTAPRYYVREVFIPGATEGSRFIKEEFTSPVKFNIPAYPTPLAAHVSYDYLGVSGSFPRCLHDDLKLPPHEGANATYYQTGTIAGGTPVVGQFFPKTNFTTWQPYVKSDDQDLRDGMWYRVRVKVYPPPLPEEITQ